GLVARLRIAGRAAFDLAAAEGEAGAVPRADHRVALALTLVERAAQVRARRRDRADLVRLLRPRDDDRLSFELDADERAAVEVVRVTDGRVPLARALERRPVDANAEPEREMPAEVRRQQRAR